MSFDIHTIETAPEKSKESLEGSLKGYGMIPNLHGVLAANPAALEAYKTLGDLFGQTSLSLIERNVVWMTSNYVNQCHYCTPAHTMIAKGAGVPDDVIESIRGGTAITDTKLDALSLFTAQVIEKRGHLTDVETKAFLDAGYSEEDILSVIIGVSHKVISNYVNHFADTPIDEPFKAFI